MRILFVADLHYTLPQFDWVLRASRSFDWVIIGGDLLDLGAGLDFDVQIVVVEKYLARLREATRVMVSSGNHDGDRRDLANESYAGWLQEARAERLFVDGDSLVLPEALVTICPWWDGPVSRDRLDRFLDAERARRNGRWIWVHHAPPQNSPVSWAGTQHLGDAQLVKWIHRHRPDLVLSGHIHNAPFYREGSWIDRIGSTWVLNPGRQLGPYPSYIALDLTDRTATWVSLEEKRVQPI